MELEKKIEILENENKRLTEENTRLNGLLADLDAQMKSSGYQGAQNLIDSLQCLQGQYAKAIVGMNNARDSYLKVGAIYKKINQSLAAETIDLINEMKK